MIQGTEIGEMIDLELCEELIKKYGSLSDVHLLIEDNGNDMTYQEVVDLVRFGKSKLNIFTEKEYYEGYIDPSNGADWNQTAPIDTKPTLEDFKKTVSDYLAWEVSTLLKNQDNEDESLGK